MGGGGSVGIVLSFLTLELDGSSWSGSRPCRFTTGKGAPGIHWIGSWVGLKPVGMLWRIEKTYTVGNRTRVVQLVVIPTELSRLPYIVYITNCIGTQCFCMFAMFYYYYYYYYYLCELTCVGYCWQVSFCGAVSVHGFIQISTPF
jgi:hypothetical protein